MERNDAFEKLKKLESKDIRPLADKYEVTVWKNGKKNKGWFGHTIERYLGLPINSAQSPNFGSWELKTVPLKKLKNGKITVKETMAITMIDDYNVKTTSFEKSHLFAKLQKAIICVRMFESQKDDKAVLVKVFRFDLENEQILEQIRNKD